jgi:hypothetical protein
MARYFPDEQKTEMAEWLLELRGTVTPDDSNTASSSGFSPKRDRARMLVRLLDSHRADPQSDFDYEFDRVWWIWQRLEGGQPRAIRKDGLCQHHRN